MYVLLISFVCVCVTMVLWLQSRLMRTNYSFFGGLNFRFYLREPTPLQKYFVKSENVEQTKILKLTYQNNVEHEQKTCQMA